MKLGRNLARTFLDYYKLQNHIVFNPTAAIIPKLANASSYLKNTTSLLNSTGTSSSGSNTVLSSSLLANNGGKFSNNVKRSSSNVTVQGPLKPIASPGLIHNSNSSMSNGSGGSQTANANANNDNATSTVLTAAGNNSSNKSTKFYLDNND